MHHTYLDTADNDIVFLCANGVIVGRRLLLTKHKNDVGAKIIMWKQEARVWCAMFSDGRQPVQESIHPIIPCIIASNRLPTGYQAVLVKAFNGVSPTILGLA